MCVARRQQSSMGPPRFPRVFDGRVVRFGALLILAGCASREPTVPIVPSPAAAGTVYHFEHLQTGARKLRGGSFPGDILVYPMRVPGVTKTPSGVAALRVGQVRVPRVLLGSAEPNGDATAAKALQPVRRAVAIDDDPSSNEPLKFWMDVNGNGDLTDDVIDADATPRPFALSNPQITKVLSRFGTGTLTIGSERHAFVTGRPPGTENFYLFIASDAWRPDHPDDFVWERAVGLFFEGPPLVNDWPQGVLKNSALCGVLRIGPREDRGHYLTIVDLANPEAPRLLVDRDGKGRLDEPAISLTKVPQNRVQDAGRPTIEQWTGSATLAVRYPGANGQPSTTLPLDVSLDLRIRRSADGDKAHADVSLTYRGEWGRRGTIHIGGEDHAALLFDELGSGDYRGSQGGNDSGVRLLIDLNDNGTFERDEAFDPSKEFAIGGTRVAVKGMDPSAASFRLVEVGSSEPAGTP